MATITPLRRSLRIADAERRRDQQKKDVLKLAFKNQIADLKAVLSKLGDIINSDDTRRATWRKAEQLTQVCGDHCLDLWLLYETDDPVIKTAAKSFGNLHNLTHTMYILSPSARVSDEHYEQLISTYNKFLLGVDTIESALL